MNIKEIQTVLENWSELNFNSDYLAKNDPEFLEYVRSVMDAIDKHVDLHFFQPYAGNKDLQQQLQTAPNKYEAVVNLWLQGMGGHFNYLLYDAVCLRRNAKVGQLLTQDEMDYIDGIASGAAFAYGCASAVKNAQDYLKLQAVLEAAEAHSRQHAPQ